MPTSEIPRMDLVSKRIICTPLLAEHAESQVDAILESSEALDGSMPWYHEGFGIDEARWWTTWCQEAWEAGTHYEFAVVDMMCICSRSPLRISDERDDRQDN